MATIVVPIEYVHQFWRAKGETELRDPAGNLLGRFVPPVYEIEELDLTEEELADLLRPDRPTFTTAEVLAYAKGLVS